MPALLGLFCLTLYGARGARLPADAVPAGGRASDVRIGERQGAAAEDARAGERQGGPAEDAWAGERQGGAAPDAWAGERQGGAAEDLPPGRERMVALTFDDGPHPVCTAELLDGLKARGVRATFFVIGENAKSEPQLVARAAAEGHRIGNHTYSHVRLTDCSEEASLGEVSRTNELLYEITGSVTEYIRPPFGLWSRLLEESFPLRVVLWDVDPMDWKHRDADYIVREVLSAVEDGSIILLHDIYETSVEAALRIVDRLQAEGYVFVTVDELFPD